VPLFELSSGKLKWGKRDKNSQKNFSSCKGLRMRLKKLRISSVHFSVAKGDMKMQNKLKKNV
jgi:hypothetical protein